MTRMSRISGLALVLALLVVGCNESEKSGGPSLGLLSVDQREQHLKGQIDRKYESPQAHYELGRIYHTDGRWDKAEIAYRTAVWFDPMLWDAEAALVKLAIDRGDLAKSQMVAQAAMERAKFSAEMSLELAKSFQKEYLDDYALRCHSQALALAPDSAAVYKHIGFYYLNRRDMARAETNLRYSFELDPYQPEVSGELGRMGVIVEVPGVEVAAVPKRDTPSPVDLSVPR